MNFFMFGGCEINDTIDYLKANNPQHEFETAGSTTLGSLYSKHGRIADDVYKWYHTEDSRKNRNMTSRIIYKEAVEKNHIDAFKSYGWKSKDSWIIISFAYESQPRYYYDDEMITLIPELINSPDSSYMNILEKLKFPVETLEQINDIRYNVSWDDPHIGNMYWSGRGDWLPKLGDTIKDFFEDRVILIYTPPARKYYNKSFGVYNQLPKAGNFIPGYWMRRDGRFFENYSWEKVNKGYTGIYNGFRRWYPHKTKLIKFDWNDMIGDDHHRWGKNPFHYTHDTIQKISKEILSTVKNLDKNS